MATEYRCIDCDIWVPDYLPMYCCNSRDCGCHGQPIDPCLCTECENKLMGKPTQLLKLFRIMVQSLPKGTPIIMADGSRNSFVHGMVMYVLGEDEDSTIEYFQQHNHMDAWLKNVEMGRIKIDEVPGPYKHGYIIERHEFGV